MKVTYHCGRCQREFTTEKDGTDPRCPQCGRTDSIEPAKSSELIRDIWRQWLLVAAILALLTVAYVVFEVVKG